MTAFGLGNLASSLNVAISQATARALFLLTRAVLASDKVLFYLEAGTAAVGAGAIIANGAVQLTATAFEAVADMTDKVVNSYANNTRQIPAGWSARGFALEQIGAQHLGEAYLGGNVNTIDVFEGRGARIAASFKSHSLDPGLPDLEGRYIAAFTRDAEALIDLESRDIRGVRADGSRFQLASRSIGCNNCVCADSRKPRQSVVEFAGFSSTSGSCAANAHDHRARPSEEMEKMSAMKQPSFGVYLNRKSGEFLLSRQFLDDHGLACDTGKFIRFSTDQMKAECAHFAQRHFAEFETRTVSEQSEFQTMSSDEERQFFQNHDCVWVYRPTPAEVVFWPRQIVKRRGRFIDVGVDPEDTIHMSWPASAEKLFTFLMDAFEKTP